MAIICWRKHFQGVQMKLIKFLLYAVSAMWVMTIAFWMSTPSSPIEQLGGDTVSPERVRAGEIVTVTRNFRIIRNQAMSVSRTMILGDCEKRCEIVDLPSGHLTLAPGDYINIQREHVIPATTDPGEWRLVFSVNWQDRLGRTINERLPELTIEVVK